MLESAGAAAFDAESMGADFQQVDAQLLRPPRVQGRALLFIGSIVAFVAIAMLRRSNGMVDLAMLVGVLLVHELGHAAAMRLFGYRDVRIFFIPFLGAAASGKKSGVATWKQAIVLLAGPLPGIVAGSALVFVNEPHAKTLALELLLINGLNLLPVSPLDGGRLFQLVLFSRHHLLEVLFIGATGAILFFASLYTHAWALAVVGYLVLLTLRHRQRVLAVAARWRPRKVRDDWAALDEEQRRALYVDAWYMLPAAWREKWRGKPQPQAQTIAQILESAAQIPPSYGATVGLLATWLLGIAATLIFAVGVLAVPSWKTFTHEAPRFTIEMPAPPLERSVHGKPLWTARVGLRRDYAVAWAPIPPGLSQKWLDARERAVLGRDHLIEQREAPDPERRFVYRTSKGSVMVARLLCAGGYGYAILAAAPTDEPDSERFVGSFTPGP